MMEKKTANTLNAVIAAGMFSRYDSGRYSGLKPNLTAMPTDGSIILVDGQAGFVANGGKLLPASPLMKCPIFGDMVEYSVIAGRLKDAAAEGNGHPYDQMVIDTCQMFPNCKEEIIAFFELEKSHNAVPIEDGSAVGRNSSRSLQWSMFWSKVKELNMQRHNEDVRKKRAEKLARKSTRKR